MTASCIIILNFFLVEDFECCDCGRLWRVPGKAKHKPPETTLVREPPVKAARLSKVEAPQRSSGKTKKVQEVHMCPNLWCDYFIEESDKRSVNTIRHDMKR